MEMMEIPRKVRKKRTITKPYNAKREVSVKHLLSSQPGGYDSSKTPYFEVNVRVGFNGKYINFRSYTLAKRKLGDDLVNEIMFKREKELIVLYVECLIKKHKLNTREDELPEDNPFDLGTSFYGHEPSRLCLQEVVESILFRSVFDFEEKYLKTGSECIGEMEVGFQRSMQTNVYLYVLYQKQFDERYQEVIDQYPTAIWTFKIFINLLNYCFDNEEDVMNGTQIAFNLADYKNGFFQTTAKSYGKKFNKTDEVNLIISWLDTVIEISKLEERIEEEFYF